MLKLVDMKLGTSSLFQMILGFKYVQIFGLKYIKIKMKFRHITLFFNADRADQQTARALPGPSPLVCLVLDVPIGCPYA